jgi:diguanylate cyclase (GGDEF)-like protein
MLLLADSATWIAVGLALGAALLALVLAGAVLALRRRTAPREEIERLLDASNRRLERTLRDLGGALENAQAETRRSRLLADIASTIDIDSVLERILAAGASLAGVDAAMILIPDDEDGEPLVATIGMSPEEALRQPVSSPPGGGARAVRIAYRYSEREESASEEGELIRGGVAVPLRNDEGEVAGTFAVFWRGPGRDATEEELTEVEELAASAGPAILNAQRFREARQLADLDGLTNLHNRRYFHETLARECARAQRYDRRLALVVVDVDDFKAINDRIGHLAGDGVLASVAERLQSVVRGADIACRVGGDEFAVILPESSLADAEQLYRRIQFAVSSRAIAPAERIHVSAGIAELRPDDDAVTFFQRADGALYRAKGSGKGQVRDADSSGAPS